MDGSVELEMSSSCICIEIMKSEWLLIICAGRELDWSGRILPDRYIQPLIEFRIQSWDECGFYQCELRLLKLNDEGIQ